MYTLQIQRRVFMNVVRAFLGSLILSVGLLCAQSKTAAELSGVVTDVSKAVIPSAKLTITNAETSETRTVITDGRGEYRFLSLSPGTYEITVEKDGFTPKRRKGLVLTVGGEYTRDFEL